MWEMGAHKTASHTARDDTKESECVCEYSILQQIRIVHNCLINHKMKWDAQVERHINVNRDRGTKSERWGELSQHDVRCFT